MQDVRHLTKKKRKKLEQKAAAQCHNYVFRIESFLVKGVMQQDFDNLTLASPIIQFNLISF